MDEQFSWKRSEDIEIDLGDLLRRFCGQWKRIAVCAITAAVILGGCGWLKGWRGLDADESGTVDEAVLTEAEEQAVADAIRLEGETRELETYLDNSLLMQLDPYHKNKFVMLYCIDQAERQELPGITESYLNFILNGGAADALQESGNSSKTDKSYLAEVISAYQKTYSSPYQIVVNSMEDSRQMAESLFYVEIVGRDAEETKVLALDIQAVLEEYSARVIKNAGSHRLKLISSQKSVTVDSGLLTQQRDREAQLLSDITGLKAMTDAFSKEQMAVYKESVYEEDGWEEDKLLTDAFDEEVSDEGFEYVIKYMLLGFVAGIIVYGCAFLCWYIFRDTVKSTEEMKRLYTFPVYGGILPDSKQGKDILRPRYDAFGHTEEQVLNRIRLSCRKQGITNLCAVSCCTLSLSERKCLENMARHLKAWGIDLEVSENTSTEPGVWDGLTEAGNVLMVCSTGLTTHRMIDDVMNFCLENGINVTGAVAFLQNI